MTIYSPTYIYLGNDPTQINPNWNSSVETERWTTADEANVVTGWSFDDQDMQGVQVTGNATAGGGSNFGRGQDLLTYSLDDGLGGSVVKTALYTSHVVVNVTVDVVRYDPTDPAANAQGLVVSSVSLRGVLVQMENGDLFMRPYFTDQGIWETTMADWAIDAITIDSVADQVDNTDAFSGSFSGATSFPPDFIGTLPEVPCFASGTLIDTDAGPRPIETLVVGDRLLNANGELRAVRWIGKCLVTSAQMRVAGYLRPVRISAGALGPDLPAQDLLVSPQHRLVISSNIAVRMFGEGRVLVAAKHLIGLPGISAAEDVDSVTYFHLLLDQHEIIRSNGLPSESLLPRCQALASLGAEAERELRGLFPELFAAEAEVEAALPCIPGRQARSLMRRHTKNQQRVLAPVPVGA